MELMPVYGYHKGHNSLRREMSRLFEDFFTGSRWAGPSEGVAGFPLDMFDNEEELVVTAEVPGIDREDLDVTVTGSTLSITGEKKMAHDETGEARRTERTFGRFSRSVALPEGIDPAKVTAELANGILTLRLAKREETKPKTIDVAVG